MKRVWIHFAFAGLAIACFAVGAFAQGHKTGKTTKATCPGVNGLTAVEIGELLSVQNLARAEHKLAPLKWDCKLADHAQEWANQGQAAHRDDTSYGENIFVSSAAHDPAASAVHKWILEKANWTNKTGKCVAGKICTHYTQMVWKKTTHVGCGVNRNATGKWKVLLVCNYDPAGNHPGAAY